MGKPLRQSKDISIIVKLAIWVRMTRARILLYKSVIIRKMMKEVDAGRVIGLAR